MFEESLLTAPTPGVDPVTGRPAAWPPEPGDGPHDPADAELESLLAGLAREYAVPAAGVLLVDVDELPPGPELAGALAAFDPSAADASDLVEAAAGLERLEAWAAARKAAVLAELASRPQMRPDLSGYRSVNPVTNTAAEVAGRCHVTARQAENQVGHALQLTEDFPDTHTTLSSGLIDVRRARVITDELGGQDPDVRTRVEAAVLPKAPELDAVALRKLIRRLLHELAPVEQAERHRAARDRRYVAIMPASDGMAHLEALLPAEDATALNTALNVAAADAKRADTATGAPARTKDQRRADALAALGWAALAACADAATIPADSPQGGAAGSPGADHAGGGTAGPGPGGGRAGGSAGRACDDPATDANGGRAGDGAGGPGNFHAAGVAGRTPGNPATGAGDRTAGHTPSNPATGATDDSTGDVGVGAGAGAGAGASVGVGLAAARAARSGGPPARPGGAGPRRPISVHVTVPLAVLAGLSDEGGDLDGYGPIPAHVARALAAEGVWTWLATDPGTRRLLDHGRTRYRPTKALARFIVARDHTCRAPGCHRTARNADIDHIVPFAAGGTTSADNLHALCEHHHLLKHHGRWYVAREPDGTTRWTSPTGHHYARAPEAPS